MAGKTLIFEVQNHPELYDPMNDLYDNLLHKEAKWQEVGLKLNRPGITCKKNWWRLIRSYKRAMKRKEFGNATPTIIKLDRWIYEKEMSFLKNLIEEKDMETNTDTIGDNSETIESEIDLPGKCEKNVTKMVLARIRERLRCQPILRLVDAEKELMEKMELVRQARNRNLHLFFAGVCSQLSKFSANNQNVIKSNITEMVRQMERAQNNVSFSYS